MLSKGFGKIIIKEWEGDGQNGREGDRKNKWVRERERERESEKKKAVSKEV